MLTYLINNKEMSGHTWWKYEMLIRMLIEEGPIAKISLEWPTMKREYAKEVERMKWRRIEIGGEEFV